MAFGILHYALFLEGIVICICVLSLARRYWDQRGPLTLVFMIFMIAYAAETFIFVSRGFFENQSPVDILLWRVTHAMYPIMTVPLALFLAYPYLKEKAGTRAAIPIQVVMLYCIAVLVFNIAVISASEVEFAYEDPYGFSHFRFVSSFVLEPYSLTLILVILVAFASVVFLGISARRETDPFYRNRAQLLMFGWLIVVLGQIFTISPDFAILNPFATIAGLLLLVSAILRTKK